MALLDRGYRVCLLVRGRGEFSAQERVRRLFSWLEGGERKRPGLRVFQGNLDDRDLGLETGAYDALRNEIGEIVHCASDTSFAERRRRQVEKANVANLDNLLDFASKSSCYFIHHISTAYVAGKRTGCCPEALVETGDFTNVYEETKYLAERHLDARCGKNGIRLNIYRPSIVYGHSRTGKSLRFNALYYPMRILVFLKDIYQKDIEKKGGEKAKTMGVRMGDKGRIHLPIRIEALDGGINLIPIDYFAKAFMALMEAAVPGGQVFHVINSKETSIETLIDYAKLFFGITGIQRVSGRDFLKLPRNGLEILFEYYMKAYRAYMHDERTFEDDLARAILDRRRLTCPDLDFAVFSRCMQYAVDMDWGRDGRRIQG
jgi:nucleoside-diphosphate-sugar epimerase